MCQERSKVSKKLTQSVPYIKACQKVFKEVLLASEAGFKHYVLEAQKNCCCYKNDSRKTRLQKHIEIVLLQIIFAR